MFFFLKRISPEPIRKIARNIRTISYSYFDNYKDYLSNIRYLGFIVYYTKGAGLINRIRFGNTNSVYEFDLVNSICTKLKNKANPIFLDIGANIGLISLAVIKEVPDVKVFSFEPGYVAYKSFDTTIFANKLEAKLKLSNLALSDSTGSIDFFSHEDSDTSGDGFIDTGRAKSLAKKITVKTDTLDNWLENQKLNKIDLIKIDVEGAELLVLKGASISLKKYKPIIFLEISKENLKVYPYNEADILNYLESIDYSLYDLKNIKCSEGNISDMIKNGDTFMAMSNR